MKTVLMVFAMLMLVVYAITAAGLSKEILTNKIDEYEPTRRFSSVAIIWASLMAFAAVILGICLVVA